MSKAARISAGSLFLSSATQRSSNRLHVAIHAIVPVDCAVQFPELTMNDS